VLTARLSVQPKASRLEGAVLGDFRRFDAHETSRALPIENLGNVEWHIPNITCMCQCRPDKQIFATCDDQNDITIWRWKGTDASDPDRMASRVYGSIGLRPEETVLQMCFLSGDMVPRRIIDRHGTVLVILKSWPDSTWVVMQVVAVYPGCYCTELLCPVPIGEQQAHALQAGHNMDINFLETTVTGNFLVLGGRGLCKVFCVDVVDDKISIEAIADICNDFPEMRHVSVVSYLSLPLVGTNLHWFVVGTACGKLYGWAFRAFGGGRRPEVRQSERHGDVGRGLPPGRSRRGGRHGRRQWRKRIARRAAREWRSVLHANATLMI